MKNIVACVLALFLFGVLSGIETAKGDVRLETNDFAIQLNDTGSVSELVDKQTGKNWLRPKFDQRFCLLTMSKGGPLVGPKSIARSGDLLKVTFTNDAVATLKLEMFPKYMTLEVVSVESPGNEGFYRLEFGRAFSTLDYKDESTFALSSLIMNINTNIVEMSGLSSRLGGVCYSEIGYKGAKIAVMGTPIGELRDTLKKAVELLVSRAQKDAAIKASLPVLSKSGGPYAMDQAKSHGNYIITSTPIVAEETERWANRLKQFGVDQVDFHMGVPFKQADFTFNEKSYPNGVSDFRKMTDAFRKQGIIAGLHTYATCVPMNGSKFVAPIPHDDLCVMETFTLAEPLSAESTELKVNESTDHVSTTVGYLVWNSLYLRIDNEIVKYTEVLKDGKKGFAACQRGMCGTSKAAHAQGAAVRHLGSLFSSFFAPEPGSPLYFQIARDTAKAYDEGGFKMIYLDALDGNSRTVKNKELVWYYDALFVREILNHIKTDAPLLEYSTMHPSLWGARSRMGAWDSPSRGFIQFLDQHFASNYQSATRRFLPGQMGWMGLCPSLKVVTLPNFQRRYFYPEEIEYMGVKSLAWDFGMSYLDIGMNQLAPAIEANGKIMKNLDTLRRQKYFSESICKQLREPRKFFSLEKEGDKWYFRQAEYCANKLVGAKNEIEVVNEYSAQKPTLRIENLHPVESYESEKSVVLAAFDEKKPAEKIFTQTFDPPLNLKSTPGMGMWIFGNGKGQVINIRTQSPSHLFAGVGDHYVKVDFTGWKYIAWAEAENGAYPELRWPVPGGIYLEFRNAIRYDSISNVHVMVNGDPSELRFRTLKALPIGKSTLTNPKVTIGGKTLAFTGSMPNGSWMQYTSGDKAQVFDIKGQQISEMTVTGELSPFASGTNKVTVESTSGEGFAFPRSLWTWGFLGDRLK